MEENVFEKMKRERMEWREKFLAASPEEQQKMLEEKEAKREQAEKARKKAIYDDRKKRFFEKADQQIKILEVLIKAQKISFEVIKSFDGKILNNRLTKVLIEKLQALNSSLNADLVISYNRQTERNEGKIEIRMSHYGCGGLRNTNSIYIPLTKIVPFTSDGDRVVFSDAEQDMRNDAHFLTDILDSWKSAKKEYDKVHKEADKLSAAIEKYCHMNYCLRDFFKADHVIDHLWNL